MADLRDALIVGVDPTAAFVPTRNPYRGLAPFEQADADDFHGREHAVQQMVEVLEHERLLVVVGPSGIGKSSVVKAGLLPALAGGVLPGSETWLVTEMVPGQAPFDALAAALGRIATVTPPDIAGELATSDRSLDDIARDIVPDGTGVVVVVDQFEELFTQTIDDRERRAFLRMMVDAAAGGSSGVVRVVATLRADYFDRPLAYPGIGDAIKGRTVAIGAMSDAELAEAVRLPAEGVGIDVEPQLVERITADAAVQPGALPARAAHDGRALRPPAEQRDHTRRVRGIRRPGGRDRPARRGDLRRVRRATTRGHSPHLPSPRHRQRGPR